MRSLSKIAKEKTDDGYKDIGFGKGNQKAMMIAIKNNDEIQSQGNKSALPGGIIGAGIGGLGLRYIGKNKRFAPEVIRALTGVGVGAGAMFGGSIGHGIGREKILSKKMEEKGLRTKNLGFGYEEKKKSLSKKARLGSYVKDYGGAVVGGGLGGLVGYNSTEGDTSDKIQGALGLGIMGAGIGHSFGVDEKLNRAQRRAWRNHNNYSGGGSGGARKATSTGATGKFSSEFDGLSAREAKKKRNDFARKYHPDRNPGDKAAEENMKHMNNAYSMFEEGLKKK